MSNSIRRALLGAAAIAALAAPASATKLLVTFTGTSDSQFSFVRTDGVTEALAPAALSGSFTLDTDLLPADTGTGDDYDYFSDATPFLTDVSVTIGGTAPDFGGTIYTTNALYGAFGPGGYVELQDGRTASDSPTFKATSLFRLYGDLFRSALVAGGKRLPDLNGANGLLFDLSSSATRFDAAGNPVSDRYVFTSGTIDSISVSTAAAVPEPATWATMVLGFAVAGAAMRRRRLAPVVAG